MEQTLRAVQEYMRARQGTRPGHHGAADALRKRWERLRERASETADHVPEHLRPLLAECEAGNDPDLSQSQGSDPNERVLMEVLEYMQRHQGCWPRRRDEGGALRQRLAKDPAGTVTEGERQLLAEYQAGVPPARWTQTQRRAHKWEPGRRQAALREACAAWSAEVGAHVPHLPQLQLTAGPANTFGGTSPFPGLGSLRGRVSQTDRGASQAA